MEIIHRGEDLGPVEPGRNLLELLRPVLGNGPDARIVTRLLLDGEAVDDERLVDLAGISFDGVSRVEVDSKPASDVALRTRAHTVEYAGRLRVAGPEVAASLRSEPIERSGPRLAEWVDALTVILGTAELLAETLVAAKEDDPSLTEIVEALAPWLAEMANAQEERDWVRVADLVEYEMEEPIERLHGWLESLTPR